jgi:hypothetical protein
VDYDNDTPVRLFYRNFQSFVSNLANVHVQGRSLSTHDWLRSKLKEAYQKINDT